MGSIKNAFKFIFSPTASRTTGILVILIIAAAVPLTVFIAQKQQELRQRAATVSTVDECINSCVSNNNCNSQNDPTGDCYVSCVSQCSTTLSPTATLIPTVPATPTSGCTGAKTSDECFNRKCTWYNNFYCDKSTTQPIPTPTPFNCSQPGYGCYPSSDSPNGVPLPAGYTTTCDTPNTGLVCYELVSTPTLPPSTPIPTVQPTAQQSTTTPTQQNVPSVTPTSSLIGDFNLDGCIGIKDFNAWSQAYVNNVSMPNSKTPPTLLDFNVWYNAMLTTSQDKICKGE